VSTALALLVLLGLAWLGAALTGKGAVAAGATALVAGAVLGPAGLGVAGPDLLAGAAPLAEVAVGWLALALGLSLGVRDGRALPAGRVLGAAGISLAVGLPVAAAVGTALGAGGPWDLETLLVAGGAAAALAPSARDTLGGLAARLGARGPVTALVCDLAETDDVAPVLATAALFALGAGSPLAARLGAAGAAAAGLALGAALGLAAGLLVRLSPRAEGAAGQLFATSLVGIGLSSRMGVSPLATGLALGAAAALVSGQRALLARLARTLDGAVALPALLLAGAMLEPFAHPSLPVAALAGVGAAFLAKVVTGPALGLGAPAATRAGLALSLARLSPGAFGVYVGLAFALRFPGPVGRTVLAVAAAGYLAGELLAPASLRRALARAGELPAEAPPAPAAAGAEGTP